MAGIVAILNITASGKFSSDRTVAGYAKNTWADVKLAA
jgi:glucan phosphorylase